MNRKNFQRGAPPPPHRPCPEKEKAYNSQTFAARPATLIQDKKNGTKVNLITNHAIVRLPEQTIPLYCYKVTVFVNNREVTKREKAAPVFWKTVEQNVGALPKNFVFNDVDFIWSSERFSRETGRLELAKEVMVQGRRERKVQARVTWQYTGPIQFGAAVSREQDSQLLVTLIDAIATARVRHPSNANFYTVFKRLTYLVVPNPKEPELDGMALYVPCDYGTEARLGISIAIKMNLRAGPTACFDLNHTLFTRPAYPIIRLLIELIEGGLISDEEFEERFDEALQNCRPDHRNVQNMLEIMKGMTLVFSLTSSLPRTKAPVSIRNPNGWKETRGFKFDGFGQSAIDERFPLEDGRMVSVAEYFRDQYNIVLRYPHLPVIRKKSAKKSLFTVYYPMEMCSYLASPEKYKGAITDSMKLGSTSLTAYDNAQRLQLLQHLVAQKKIAGAPPVISDDNEEMKKFNLKVDKEMIQVKATELNAPKMLYGNGEIVSDVNGVWEAVKNVPIRKVLQEPMIHGKKKIVLGSILRIDVEQHENAPEMQINNAHYHYLMNALKESGQPIVEKDGFAEVQADFFYRKPRQPGEILDHLARVRHDAASRCTETEHIVPMVLVVFRTRMSHLKYVDNDYNILKWLGDNAVGVHTQGILLDTYHGLLEDRTKCAHTHLLVEKILGKLGSTHRKITSHKPWQILTNPSEPTLVLGVDVCHPKPQDRDAQGTTDALSIAAIVGNIDHEMCEFRSSARIQDTGDEQIVSMEHEVQIRVLQFQQNTGKLPKHVVVYRDGICEGDFQKYLFEERQSIERAFEMLGAPKPTLTYIVVSKRHRTKFFLESNPAEHIKPGTLIEDGVTDNRFYDFYLSTQVGGDKGTVRPMHYYVLYDEWAPMDGFWPGVTQAFTYNFCRTTSSIALPAPVLYAHLAAKRAKETLNAVNIYHCHEGIRINPHHVESQEKLTKQINVNLELDGMTFV